MLTSHHSLDWMIWFIGKFRTRRQVSGWKFIGIFLLLSNRWTEFSQALWPICWSFRSSTARVCRIFCQAWVLMRRSMVNLLQWCRSRSLFQMAFWRSSIPTMWNGRRNLLFTQNFHCFHIQIVLFQHFRKSKISILFWLDFLSSRNSENNEKTNNISNSSEDATNKLIRSNQQLIAHVGKSNSRCVVKYEILISLFFMFLSWILVAHLQHSFLTISRLNTHMRHAGVTQLISVNNSTTNYYTMIIYHLQLKVFWRNLHHHLNKLIPLLISQHDSESLENCHTYLW